MNKFAFLKKELMEILKTSKKIVLPALFLFFGFMSPLTARYMKEIFKALSGGTDIYSGLIPDIRFEDSYIQLFSNLGQIGFIVMILSFMGAVVDEKVKGTASLVITKGVTRTQFILSKFLSRILLFTVSYVLALAVTIYYTYLLFPKFYNNNLWSSILLFWIYGILIISVIIFSSTVSKSYAIGGAIGFLSFSLFGVLSMIPKVQDYSPSVLGGMWLTMTSGTRTLEDAIAPLIISLILIVALISGSIGVFKRQEI